MCPHYRKQLKLNQVKKIPTCLPRRCSIYCYKQFTDEWTTVPAPSLTHSFFLSLISLSCVVGKNAHQLKPLLLFLVPSSVLGSASALSKAVRHVRWRKLRRRSTMGLNIFITLSTYTQNADPWQYCPSGCPIKSFEDSVFPALLLHMMFLSWR